MTTLYSPSHVTPDAIHAAATLNHLAMTPPAAARILELGCGAAERLVMHACTYPQSIIIGIDVIEAEIASGQQLAASFGCSNIELCVAGLGDLLAVELGEFDYIIIHHAFAQIGATERDVLLGWCQAHLAENGVVAIRWSILPNSTPRHTLGHALHFHLTRVRDEADLLASARAMLSYMLVTLGEGGLKDEVLAAEKMDDTTLVETYLAASEAGDTLVTFCDAARALGLQYRGDLMPQYETGNYYSPLIAQMLNVVSADTDRVMAQQYLDYAIQRTERFSLLGHDAVGLPLAPDLDCLRRLHWAGCFIRQQDADANIYNSFRNSQGLLINTDNTILISILELLGNAWPMSLSFEQLVFNCKRPEDNEDVQQQVLESLKVLFMNDELGLHWSGAPGIYNQARNDLLISAVSLPTRRIGQPLAVMNLWGESVSITPAEWDYLQSDMHKVDTAAWECYSALKIKGLLIGSTTAWKQQLQHFLRHGQIDVLKSQISLLLLLSVSQDQGGLLQDQHQVSTLAEQDTDIDKVYAKINLQIKTGHFQQARQFAQELLQNDPENVHLLRCYSRACVLTSAWDDALETLCKLMGYYFADKDIFYDLAVVLHKKRQYYYARIIIRALLKLDKSNLDYWQNLASVNYIYSDMLLAEKCCRIMLRFNPQQANYYDMIGIIFSGKNKIDEARYFMEKAIEMSGHDFVFFSNLLFVMSHDVSVTAEELWDKHLEYGQKVHQWVKSCGLSFQLDNDKSPQRKLRIGFVSGDLRVHPVANFLMPFWNGLDRSKYELVAYSTITSKDDAVSLHFKNTSLLWHEVDALSNDELAKMIVEDKIDILFDLAGHTAYNRLPIFALRLAPIQISWIGYPGTSGLAEMDYRLLTSTLANTPGLEKQFSEHLMFVETRKLFEPYPASPAVNELPALHNGYITFGSFNRRSKLNDEVLKVWADILLQYPQARLVLGCMPDDESIVTIQSKLDNLGIYAQRIVFYKFIEMEQYLAYHHDIDILLDAFPYTGGTTTHHGAWMGVPTLTIGGETPAGLQGVDIMRSYGLEQFIASDKEDYIRKALSWSDRLDELNSIRLGMRNYIPTENEDGFEVAATFERGLREAWGLYCRGEPPRAMLVEEKKVSFI